MEYSEKMVLECACLHRQCVQWVLCPHQPPHQDLADAFIHFLETKDPVTIKAVRSATAGRRPVRAASEG